MRSGSATTAADDVPQAGRRSQIAWTVLFLATVGVALVGLAFGVLLDLIGDSACPTPGRDSEWGRLSWSVFPPGPRCTWTERLNGVDRVDGPGPVMSVWLVGLVVLVVVLWRWHRRAFPLR